jgi:hypothetical protein
MSMNVAAKPTPAAEPKSHLSEEAKAITEAFDKYFPYNEHTDTVDNLPDSATFKGELPKGSAAAKMAKSDRYDFADVYTLHLAKQECYVVVGTADAIYEIGIYDMDGKEIAFNGLGTWEK